jgi:hypothetical protein
MPAPAARFLEPERQIPFAYHIPQSRRLPVGRDGEWYMSDLCVRGAIIGLPSLVFIAAAFLTANLDASNAQRPERQAEPPEFPELAEDAKPQANSEPPSEWVEPLTGHRVIRLSRERGPRVSISIRMPTRQPATQWLF